MSKKGKRLEFQACTIKKVHYNFLTAMNHCNSLQKIMPFHDISIYKCDWCEGMHVTSGRNFSEKLVRKQLKNNLKHMGNYGWWLYATPEAIEYRINFEMFLIRRLSEIELERLNGPD